MTSCFKVVYKMRGFFLLHLALILCSAVPVAECWDLENLPIKMPGDVSGLVKDLLSGQKMNSTHTFLFSVFSSIALCNHALWEVNVDWYSKDASSVLWLCLSGVRCFHSFNDLPASSVFAELLLMFHFPRPVSTSVKWLNQCSRLHSHYISQIEVNKAQLIAKRQVKAEQHESVSDISSSPSECCSISFRSVGKNQICIFLHCFYFYSQIMIYLMVPLVKRWP